MQLYRNKKTLEFSYRLSIFALRLIELIIYVWWNIHTVNILFFLQPFENKLNIAKQKAKFE